MKTTNKRNWFALGTVLITLALVSWRIGENNQLPVKNIRISYQDGDTGKPKKKIYRNEEITPSDLDDAMKEIDRAMDKIDKNLKVEIPKKVDLELKQAMEELKKVDYSAIAKEVSDALKSVDWSATSREISKALKEVDLESKQISKEKMRAEMAEVKKQLEAAKLESKINLEGMQEVIEKSMQAARKGIEKAREQIGLMKEGLNEMEKEGLIDKKKAYKIQFKDGDLFIDGNKQPKATYEKYRKYFKEDDFTIRNDGEGIRKV